VTRPKVVAEVVRYYELKLSAFGTTPAGVDWNSASSQVQRFEQFAPLLAGATTATVGDYGCGYGALLEYLRAKGHRGGYTGFDVSPAMIAAARERHRADADATFVDERSQLGISDFTFASGIFNVRLDVGDAEWRDHVFETVVDLAAVSRRGFGFNALTSYSDPDRRRSYLYYADPRDVFDYCVCRWPRRVTLHHDYDLYEFTVLVTLERG
jgi:SAM-dependent methyltransferase